VRIHRHFDAFVSKAKSLGGTWDAVHANDYPTLWPAVRIAARTGAKLVYDSHELFLATVNQFYRPKGGLKRRLVPFTVWLTRKWGRRVERSLLRRVDLFLTTNESYAEWFRKEYGVEDVRVVMNCPALTETTPDERLRTELGLSPEDRLVLYQGVLGPGRGLTSLVRSAALYDDGIRLVIVGRGPHESKLRLSATSEDLRGRVFFTGMVPYDELPPLTAEADLGVLILDPVNRSKELASANKIFEYMAAGIPVLATDFPENRRILDGSDAGWLVSGRDAPSIARAVNGIFAEPDEMRRRGENGRRAHRERYNWEREEETLLTALGELLGA
jgi:glycosyltransferase involved in cell wall biosynthesis